MRKTLAMLCALCLLLTAAIFPACAEPKGFDTPEAAIDAFVAAIVANDAQAALDTFGFEVTAKHYRLAAVADRLKTYSMVLEQPAPEIPDMYRMLNQESLKGSRARSVAAFCISFFHDTPPGIVDTPVDAAWVAEFAKKVDPAQLKALKLVRLDTPRMNMGDEELKRRLAGDATFHGALEYTERIALYELQGKLFWGGFSLNKFDEGWFINSLSSAFAGNPATGNVQPTDEAGFDALLPK